ncbi:MAG: hypothetical protein ABWY06_20130 [Pseudomonas sp.]|uniref:hypothetical protein n=1 Tax=Pseudomonas sp. TaxID=306 RepID=UPI00339297CD
MNEDIKRNTYEIISRFLALINSRDLDTLLREFNVSKPVFEEIEESLEEYFGGITPIALAPYEKAFNAEKHKRPPLDIYSMNTENCFGVECTLWINGKSSEPILHGELDLTGNKPIFRFKYIGS